MLFQFPPAIAAGLASGQYTQVFNVAGVPLGIARDSLTGQFVGHAVGVLTSSSTLFNPITLPTQLLMGGLPMYQTHQGFQAVQMDLRVIQIGLQSLQTSLGVLQATTAVIGVGVAANLAISAVSLWQILKLREDVKQLRFEVKEGFLDLKKALRDQGVEIIQRIEEVAQDIKFEQHRLVLIKAYGRFLEAIRLIKVAMSCHDPNIRNADLANARQILTEALGDYRNPQLLSETCAAGQLRRLECAWTIEQTIALIYQLQNQPDALGRCLSQLQDRMRNDILNTLDHCEFEEELDFLFPEITRIHDQDLAVLTVWQSQVDWVRSLPPSELQLLQRVNSTVSEVNTDFIVSTVPANSEFLPEQMQYEDLQQKSHSVSMLDQLRFMVRPELRREPEAYVSQQAVAHGRRVLVPANLQQMSNMAVANLYWYFKVRDEAETVDMEAKAAPVSCTYS